jgi:hypothetical protein
MGRSDVRPPLHLDWWRGGCQSTVGGSPAGDRQGMSTGPILVQVQANTTVQVVSPTFLVLTHTLAPL